MYPRNSLYRFDDIVAIQVCSQYVDDSDSGGYTTFELDMVFYGSPEARRRSILSYSNQNQVLSDAQKFADIINKPLLDHAWGKNLIFDSKLEILYKLLLVSKQGVFSKDYGLWED